MDITKMTSSEIKQHLKVKAAEKAVALKEKRIDRLSKHLRLLNTRMGKNETKVQKIMDLNAKFKAKAEEISQKLSELGRE